MIFFLKKIDSEKFCNVYILVFSKNKFIIIYKMSRIIGIYFPYSEKNFIVSS